MKCATQCRTLTQVTTKHVIEIEGKGLHKGNLVRLKIKPALPNEGIYFKRVDLENQPCIPAELSFVEEVERNTMLKKDGIEIYTVEHLLSAVCALGIDNLCIEIDSCEPVTDCLFLAIKLFVSVFCLKL